MSAKWIIISVIAVLVLGTGIGSAILIWRDQPRIPEPPKPEIVSLLRIEENKDPVKVESRIEARRDLPFHNPADRPVTVRLEAKDCECTKLLIGTAPEAWQAPDGPELLKRADDPKMTWQTLELLGPAFTAPPRAAGLLRMTWKTKGEGPHTFWFALWVDDGQAKGYQRVEVPSRFIEPVRVRAAGAVEKKEIDVGTLNPGEEKPARFLCYSPTRAKFTLTADPPREDPCVDYGKPQPLTAEELRSFPDDKTGDGVRSAYRVTVTVRERAGRNRLDIGPFHRRVAWKTDVFPDHDVDAYVNGTVRGEVALDDPDGRDFIDLGTVASPDKATPQPVTFTLKSSDPRLRLSVDEEKTLDFLKVELLDGGKETADGKGKTWKARVVFREDSLFRGTFPNPDHTVYNTPAVCSAVFLLTPQGSAAGPDAPPARRLFIPVRGNIRPF